MGICEDCDGKCGHHEVLGHNFVDDTEDVTDEHGQGTYVAGTIADIAAKGFEGEILPIFMNFDPPGRESFKKVAASIRYATDLGAEVITMTLAPSAGEIIDEAIEYAASKGAVVVVAAGDSEADEHGQGTHVAATIASITAKGFEGEILPIFMNFDPLGRESFQKVAASIRYATDLGAEVITMTLGPSTSEIIDEALEYAASKGTVVVVAAGDSNADDKKAGFSSWGDIVDVGVPGERILTVAAIDVGRDPERPLGDIVRDGVTELALHAGALAWSTLAGLTGDYVTLGGYQGIYQRLEMGLTQLRNR